MKTYPEAVAASRSSNGSVSSFQREKKKKQKSKDGKEDGTRVRSRGDSSGTEAHRTMDSPNSSSKSSGSSKTPSAKKHMLKYFIHEVRELRRQIDPDAKPVRKSRTGSGEQTPGYLEPEVEESSMFDYQSDGAVSQTSRQQTVTEETREVTRKAPDGDLMMEKTYSKQQICTTYSTRDPGDSSQRKRRLLPEVPLKRNSSRNRGVQRMSSTYPGAGGSEFRADTAEVFSPISPAPVTVEEPIIRSSLFQPIAAAKSKPTKSRIPIKSAVIDKKPSMKEQQMIDLLKT